ncbi:hypothetical protein GA8_14985 [Geobacillus sp. A8]|nr:hypothetical protein GA8_14985 [Geobacillus sp. A8]
MSIAIFQDFLLYCVRINSFVFGYFVRHSLFSKDIFLMIKCKVC